MPLNKETKPNHQAFFFRQNIYVFFFTTFRREVSQWDQVDDLLFFSPLFSWAIALHCQFDKLVTASFEFRAFLLDWLLF